MNADDAKDLMKQYEQHWGKGKTFDVTLMSKTNNLPEMLIYALNRPDEFTDQEKVELFNSIEITTVMFKTHLDSKNAFVLTAQETLDRLRTSIIEYKIEDAMTLIDVLSQLAFFGEVKSRGAK